MRKMIIDNIEPENVLAEEIEEQLRETLASRKLHGVREHELEYWGN